ncbi:MAG: hypothetical protein JWO82_2968 [Akkermansiaceae bacterium]|nr:hypothetical protein [Akkermansiaceae bacterium]
MNVLPTLEGGLRIDLETPIDWLLMTCIPADARGTPVELADQFNELMAEDPGATDWREYVLPDLRAQFDGQITLVEEALKSTGGEIPAQIMIYRADGDRWFGVLNQARLALDARYHFEDDDGDEMTPGKLTAWYRYRHYSALQHDLLRHVMR